jgi:uncharacterized circularly permuted ATP-grasp superfamily protein
MRRNRAPNCVIDGIFPAEIMLEPDNYKTQRVGVSPRYGAWARGIGTDLVRASDAKLEVSVDVFRIDQR